MIGQVYQVVNDLFWIKLTNQKKVYAKQKGYLKQTKKQVLIGDFVEIEEKKGDFYLIKKILKRKNYLTKPLIANVDTVFIIMAVKQPKLDFCFLNKILIWLTAFTEVAISLIFTKLDLLSEPKEKTITLTQIGYYQAFYPTFLFSKEETHKKTNFKTKIKGTTVFLGRSGVGKSTLINALQPTQKLKTKPVSFKTKLGRHQTIISRYWEIGDQLVVDTPGFNNQNLAELKKEELLIYFKPLANYQNRCFYHNCQHLHEPQCQLKKDAITSPQSNFFQTEWKKVFEQYQKDLTS